MNPALPEWIESERKGRVNPALPKKMAMVDNVIMKAGPGKPVNANQ